MTSLIYGYGKTGKSFERFLKNRNLKYDIYDKNNKKYNKNYEYKKYSQILCSPGIPRDTYKKLTQLNNNVLTDLDIFFKEDNSIKIGITGTNRKSTTAFHLYQLFEDFESASLVGNIGNTLLDNINKAKYSIIELSSFQLDKMIENNLDFGILLNIDKDHIDYHGSFESYKIAKQRILESNKSISYELDPYKLFKWITKIKPRKINFKNLPYRYQSISNRVINDSKSTNFHSLSYAVKKASLDFKDEEYILITCGDPAKEDFRNIKILGPEQVYIFGEHSKEIDKCIMHNKKNVFDNLEDIFKSFRDKLDSQNILFSPGYPSGKDYKDFEERGDVFNRTLKKYL